MSVNPYSNKNDGDVFFEHTKDSITVIGRAWDYSGEKATATAIRETVIRPTVWERLIGRSWESKLRAAIKSVKSKVRVLMDTAPASRSDMSCLEARTVINNVLDEVYYD
jgi:hypothetical protein